MQFHVNAGREFVYEQRHFFINAVLSALSRPGSEGAEQPPLHIRAWKKVSYPNKNVSVLLFSEQRPDEDEKTATDLIDHGIADLSISIQAIASDRTVVEVRCVAEVMFPAAIAVLKQFAQRYPEAKPEIETLLEQQNSKVLPQEIEASIEIQAIIDSFRATLSEQHKKIFDLWREGKSSPKIGRIMHMGERGAQNLITQWRSDLKRDGIAGDVIDKIFPRRNVRRKIYDIP
jgi:hypothetical protein